MIVCVCVGVLLKPDLAVMWIFYWQSGRFAFKAHTHTVSEAVSWIEIYARPPPSTCWVFTVMMLSSG